ncbi:MAG TPA: GntR family transcriptional regulator [Candidatus Dormibacteraeota bacterium]|nr:GntR family transcriptional regulator [Candidatus Dormibacteraeota bacterium]
MAERALVEEETAVISRASAIPIHTQFRAHLLRRIERGELRQGQKLPSEREYADRLGVSLAPIRQAILDLVKEGYLHRTRGRGTFVQEAKVDEKIAILSSFTQSMRAKGLDPDIHIRFRGLVAADPVIAEALRTRERKLLQIRRLASVDSEPVALLDAYLSPQAFPKIAHADLADGSLYQTMEALYGVVPTRATSTIEVIRCQEEAELLGLIPGTPALQVEGTTFDAGDRPVEFSRVIYRADRFRFTIESFHRQDRVIHLIGAPENGGAKKRGES